MLVPRSFDEANLYIDLACEAAGEVPTERKQRKATRRKVREVIEFTVMDVRCQSGKLLEFEFTSIPAARPGLRRSISYGGSQPSTIIDAGEWMMLADRYEAHAPKSVAGLSEQGRKKAKNDLGVAIACVEEVLKFIPAGQDQVSSTSLLGERGKRYFNKDIRRFRKADLVSYKSDLENRRRRYESSRV